MSDTKKVLRVHRFDPSTSSSKQKQIIQLTAEQSLEGRTLKDVREILINNHVFESKDFKSPFCEKDGSDIGDDMKVELYLALLNVTLAKASKVDIYFKTKKLFTKVDTATQEFIKQKLDLAFQAPPDVIKKNPELLTSSFDPSAWRSKQGNLSHAADLTEREWSVIIRANCLLSGHHVVRDGDNVPKKIERSAYNAFKLRPREFENHEISSADPEQDITHYNGEKYKFRIPRFRVDDNSCVTVFETKNAFETSLADSSFSEASVEVAGSVGLGPVSGGLSVGGGGGSSLNDASSKRTNDEQLIYPRVSLHWDAVCLDVTEECLQHIRKVRDNLSLRDFYARYGDLFARRVQLGGRLTCSEAKHADGESSSKDQASKFKASAQASISGSFAQASFKASHEQQKNTSKEDKSQNLAVNMAWEATGGDTLLCNNPAEWCSTVGLYSNWRIVNNSDPVPLVNFLASFPYLGKEVVERFELSRQNKFTRKKERELDRILNERLRQEEERLKKGPRQIFALEDPSTHGKINVENNSNDTANYMKQNADPKHLPKVEDIISEVRQARASVKCMSTVSEQTTQFMASKHYAKGEEHALKFGDEFRVQSLGHTHRQWLNSSTMTDEIKKSPNSGIDTWICLSEYPAGAFCLWDATNPDSEGYIRDGASVLVGISGRTIVEITSGGLVRLDDWSPSRRNQTGVKPLKFVYKTLGVIDK